MGKKQKRRRAAAKAAAQAFGTGRYDTGEELWALAVFFDKFIKKGGRGTLKKFGPQPEPSATILRVVQNDG